MSRNLDTTLAPALANPLITPAIFVSLTFQSGVFYVWNGIGNYVLNGNTYTGVGTLGKISAIQEGSDVEAQGLTVTLSGIGTSPFNADDTPPGITPPVTIPTGQSVAWSFPTSVFSYTGENGNCMGAGTLTSGTLSVSVSESFNSAGGVNWSGFQVPDIPAGAVIDAIYPVLVIDFNGAGGGASAAIATPVYTGSSAISGQFNGVSVGNTAEELIGYSLDCSILSTLDLGSINAVANISFIGLAVYYSGSTASVIADALADIQLGGPAQIYIGLMQNGSLIGTPYLAFSGQVDQPTIDTGVDTTSISLALENRLVNLARPTARRYTSADQHLKYPDDIGLNWVEVLNDMALRWGQSGS
jgi:hypothetical protein